MCCLRFGIAALNGGPHVGHLQALFSAKSLYWGRGHSFRKEANNLRLKEIIGLFAPEWENCAPKASEDLKDLGHHRTR